MFKIGLEVFLLCVCVCMVCVNVCVCVCVFMLAGGLVWEVRHSRGLKMKLKHIACFGGCDKTLSTSSHTYPHSTHTHTHSLHLTIWPWLWLAASDLSHLSIYGEGCFCLVPRRQHQPIRMSLLCTPEIWQSLNISPAYKLYLITFIIKNNDKQNKKWSQMIHLTGKCWLGVNFVISFNCQKRSKPLIRHGLLQRRPLHAHVDFPLASSFQY